MSGLTLTRPIAAARPHPLHALASALAGAVRLVTTRRELAEMDERMLRDIGLTRADARAEVARKPWDAAPTRRR